MKFREFITSSGKLVLAGKNAENNEELIKQIEKESIVLHTQEKGSPFAEIKSEEKISKEDIYETAVYIARFSQDWKKNKKNVTVHYFLGKDIFKKKDMAVGTFGVKKYKEIMVNKRDIENLK